MPESRHLTPIRPMLDPRLPSATLRSVWAFSKPLVGTPQGLHRPPGRALDEYPTGAKSNARPTSRLLNPRRSERTGSRPTTPRSHSRLPPLNLSRPQGCLRPQGSPMLTHRVPLLATASCPQLCSLFGHKPGWGGHPSSVISGLILNRKWRHPGASLLRLLRRKCATLWGADKEHKTHWHHDAPSGCS